MRWVTPALRYATKSAFALALLCAIVSPAYAATPAPSSSQVLVAYVPPRSDRLRPIADRVTKRRVLEEFKQFLAPLRLPRTLTLQFTECGGVTRVNNQHGLATICYELVEQIERVAAGVDPGMRELVLTGTLIQAVFHEAAKAVFDILQVPVWGREEDAADRLAGFLMSEFGSDVAYQTMIGAALFFVTSGKTWTGSQFAAANSPEAQRYYNYLCMAYGSDPKTFDYLTKAADGAEPTLPQWRATQCSAEFEQVRKAFSLRIMPYVDPDLLVRVRATPWSLSTSVPVQKPATSVPQARVRPPEAKPHQPDKKETRDRSHEL
jgi:hypothetical protein